MNRIGVLTSGGDAPGMNAAIAGIVRAAHDKGIEVVGIERGYRGLIEDKLYVIERNMVDAIACRGGTFLRTARCDEFRHIDGQMRALEVARSHGIGALITIGGDGTFRGAHDLVKLGLPTIGIPGTIDNDIPYTEYTIGFDTALNTVVRALTQLRDTMASHERTCVVEVMGRHCGDIALRSALAFGADGLIMPEVETDLEKLCKRILSNCARGHLTNFIILAEGAGRADDFARRIGDLTGLDVRGVTLGHVQRGGHPSAKDMICATMMGVHAVELAARGQGNRLIGIRKDEVFDIDLIEGLQAKRPLRRDMYDIALLP